MWGLYNMRNHNEQTYLAKYKLEMFFITVSFAWYPEKITDMIFQVTYMSIRSFIQIDSTVTAWSNLKLMLVLKRKLF